MLGEELYKLEEYKKVIELYNEAIPFMTKKADIYYKLGFAYIIKNDYQNAELSIKEAVELDSKLYVGTYILGKICMLANEIVEATIYFEESSKGPEIEAASYYELAKIEALKNNYDSALEYIKKAGLIDDKYIKLSKEDKVFIMVKARVKLTVEDKEKYKNKKRKAISEREQEIIDRLEHDIQISHNIGFKEMEKELAKIT